MHADIGRFHRGGGVKYNKCYTFTYDQTSNKNVGFYRAMH